jgi:RHS repeat-associated protein
VKASYVRDDQGRLVAMIRGQNRYFYHTNERGDVLAMTDETGTVVNEYRYDPWGRVLDSTVTVANPYLYASYRHDSETRLYYLWHRYYSPETMRFVTKDLYPGTTTSPATMNGYAYCLGDPVNAVDPSGLDTFGVGLTVSRAIPGLGLTRAGGGASVLLVGDTAGRMGIVVSGQARSQVGGTPALGGGVTLQYTGAPSVDDLDGTSVGFGGSGGDGAGGGGDLWASTDRQGRRYCGGDAAVGFFEGAEGHAFTAQSKVLTSWSVADPLPMSLLLGPITGPAVARIAQR